MSTARLVELAREQFSGDWTDADETLFAQTAKGEVADYGEGDPSDADKWGDDRVLKANRIEWLCTDRQAVKEVGHKGVQIIGARIAGKLHLNYAKIGFPLAILGSAVRDGMAMKCCHLYALFLDGTHTGSIVAHGLKVEHDLFMRKGFRASGEVSLLGATIGGLLNCSKGHFSNRGKRALSADRVQVDGSVFLNDEFQAKGEVRLLGAKIGGSLDCTKGHFNNPDEDALSADGVQVRGSVFFKKGFDATGAVRLLGAKIGGSLDCNKGHFNNPDEDALSADGVQVDGDVFLSDEFQGTGEVRLVGAKIGGNLVCNKGHFSHPDKDALNAQQVEVKNSVFLGERFRAEGVVDFKGAIVGGYFQWLHVEDPDACELRLESAKIGTLWDEEKSWPAKLHLDGLVYDRLDSEPPLGWKKRLEWLGRQDYDKFVPQPYVQLAKVLQEMGHEADARKILVAKQKDPARLKGLTWPAWVWHHILGVTIGYGYRPWQALLWILGFIAVGTIAFGNGANAGSPEQMMKDGATPAFNAFVYSLDTFVPLVDLHQAKNWLPATPWLCVYHWLHIGFGWILTTLLVVGLTGLVRK